jgi:hypothetical protein
MTAAGRSEGTRHAYLPVGTSLVCQPGAQPALVRRHGLARLHTRATQLEHAWLAVYTLTHTSLTLHTARLRRDYLKENVGREGGLVTADHVHAFFERFQAGKKRRTE